MHGFHETPVPGATSIERMHFPPDPIREVANCDVELREAHLGSYKPGGQNSETARGAPPPTAGSARWLQASSGKVASFDEHRVGLYGEEFAPGRFWAHPDQKGQLAWVSEGRSWGVAFYHSGAKKRLQGLDTSCILYIHKAAREKN